MDQKTRFQLSVLFPLLLALIVVTILWGVFSAMSDAGSRMRTAATLVAAVLGILALGLAGIQYVISRNFSRRIMLLEKGVRHMRQGEYDDVTRISGGDEMSKISEVFSEITGELQSYVKLGQDHSRLKNELEELQRVAESLRHTNVDLSDSLERLKRAQEQILHKEHVDTILPMISGVTHDFNEGLTSILAITELISRHPEKMSKPEDVGRWRDAVEKIVMDSKERIRALAECSGASSMQRETLRIRDVVDRAIRVTRPKWGPESETKGLKFEVQTDYQDTREIIGNPVDLAKVITHVMVNAIDAMPKGGKITVRTGDLPDGVSVQIVDTGTGMDRKLQERCFRPFFSTKDGSAGVGLTISRGIVQQHGGRMGIVSEFGHGTTVFIELPVQPPPLRAISADESQGPRLGRSLRLLLVEDDAWTMDFLADALKAEGHTVDTAANGLEGLEKYRQNKYDVVITDRAMPEMNGDELARVIKRIYPYEPVIMLTGFGEIMKGQGKIPPDVDAVVSKPVKMDVLTGAIATALIKTGQSIGGSDDPPASA